MVKTVAVLNANEDVVEMLRAVLEQAGFNTATGHVPEFKSGDQDLIEFLKTHNPDVVVYDIAPPYKQNWTFLKLVLDSDTARRRKFVFTTANKQLLREATGEDMDVYEIAEKPDNLDAILNAVKRTLNEG
jgi:DNA-binding NtrC family response regulator